MQSSIEKLSSISTLLKITVPAAEFANEYDLNVRKIMKKVRVPGFRPGKVPANIVKQQYGDSIYGDTVDVFCKKYIQQLAQENNIDFVGVPEVQVKSEHNVNVDLELEVNLQVIPELEFKPLNELNIEVTDAQISPEDVDTLIERLRSQQATWEVAADEALADGKLAKINFVGRADGVEFPGGKANDFALEAGKTQMIPGFTEQIIGHKAGDKFTIDVKFPENYHAADLAGKDAQFDIEVVSVSNKILPEVNADFMKLFGVKDSDLDGFKAEIKKNMQRELIHALRRANANAVFKALSEQYGEFEIPKALVEHHEEILLKQTMAQFRQYGIKDESFFKKFKNEAMTKEATSRARTSVVAALVSRKLEVNEPKPEYIDEELDLISQAYEDPNETKELIKKDRVQYAHILDAVLERTLVENVIAQANVTHVQKSFFDLVN